jgi:predicted NUDIX family NTP pyrophosphohydrolase
MDGGLMPVRSAGLLLYRRTDPGTLEVWIAHMGGPFWARKDAHAWSIPKGEYTEDEDPLAAALPGDDVEVHLGIKGSHVVGAGQVAGPEACSVAMAASAPAPPSRWVR